MSRARHREARTPQKRQKSPPAPNPEAAPPNAGGDEQVRTVAPFSEIVSMIPARIEIRIAKEQSVKVKAEKNLLKALTTDVRRNRLVLSANRVLINPGEIVVLITVPALTDVTSLSVGTIRISDISCDRLTLRNKGVGNITASGSVGVLTATASGFGSLNLFELTAKEADVSATDSGRIEVSVQSIFKPTASDNGVIIYRGDPKVQEPTTTGMGSVKKG